MMIWAQPYSYFLLRSPYRIRTDLIEHCDRVTDTPSIPRGYYLFVGVVGFEPTQPDGNRFTVCPDSPTSAHSH